MRRGIGAAVGVVLVAVALINVASSSSHSVAADTDTLQLVQVIFRHGDRAPTNTYPNDPVNKDPTAWPEGKAQLTSVGKMQQYKLGQYLRRRYNGFLADKYHAQELYVVSSDMDRTIMSVESNLAGLFPPVHKWHPSLDWQPIPLRTIPWKEDQYLHVNKKCPKYDQLHHEFMSTSEVVLTMNEENKDFVAHLSEKSGLRASTVKEIIQLQDIILTESIHNLTVPLWATLALPKLNDLQAQINTWSTFTDEMKRLRGGPLLDLLLKNMLAKTGALGYSSPEEKHMVVGGGGRKMLLYSAHDSTLSRIMNTIGVFHPHNPPYASSLLVELHFEDDHFVKVYYRNETDRAPYQLKIPGCSLTCRLSDLITLTEHLIPRDLKEECSLDEEKSKNSKGGEVKHRNLLKFTPPASLELEETPLLTVTPCTASSYPSPLVIGVVGVVMFMGCFFLWLCLFRLLGSGGGGTSMGKTWGRGSDRLYYERI
ncbi:prostatic acid phosphatase [Folsomia candida]|uniref:acid phosphatase n=1 Tax=Folsomia candida TaxID=158441 RepID=A0A226EV96_FOLCA|nr:prostatic acid phosphatase [Folsomia candida]OXA61492.1 Testicular acid phosphatase [Folsomia candida]